MNRFDLVGTIIGILLWAAGVIALVLTARRVGVWLDELDSDRDLDSKLEK